MVPAVGIVPVVLHLLLRNENVFPVLPSPCINPAINKFDVGRIAVGIVAAAHGRIVGHVPGRIEFLVQRLILRWMVVLGMSAALRRERILGCRGQRRHEAAQPDQEQDLGRGAQQAGSVSVDTACQDTRSPVVPAPIPSGGAKPPQPPAVIVASCPELTDALL
jgi:hypothetical protein